MTDEPVLLLAAISARALSFAARRAGFAAIAFDAFGDEDTRAACKETIVLESAMGGFAGVDLAAVLAERSRAAIGFVYGSGFDDCSDRLAAIARTTPILGTSSQALARTKDPRAFAAASAAAGLAHPEIAFETPKNPSDWLIKRQGGSGGLHIRRAGPLAPNEYWQRRVEGRPVSLLFTRSFRALTPITWSVQWTAPCPDAPYRYGGAAGPIEGPAALLAPLAALTAALGVQGLASADFLADGEHYWLLEINPRPGATLDVFDDGDDPLLSRHLAASAGRPSPPPKPRRPKGSAVVYAEAEAITPCIDWPDWAADRPAPGSRISKDAPICTVFGAGSSAAAAKAEALARAAWMRGKFEKGSE